MVAVSARNSRTICRGSALGRSLAFTFLASLTTSNLSAEPAPVLEDAVATVTVKDDAGKEQRCPAPRFPLSPGKTCFGWSIVLRDAASSVDLKEVYATPPTPTVWGFDKSRTSLSEDGRVATTRVEMTPLFGRVLFRSWCITEGDPPGAYTFHIYLNGVFVQKFCFEGVPEEKFDPSHGMGPTGCGADLS